MAPPSAPADVIRTTILSMIPSMKISEDRKRSLILEVQRSDFTLQSTVEYFIGIVGQDQYESSLAQSMQRQIAEKPVTVAGVGASRQIIPKAYAHGGDVSVFGLIDLEFESALNHALYGYAGSEKRRRLIGGRAGEDVPDLTMSLIEKKVIEAIEKRAGGGRFEVSPRFVAAVQRVLALMLMHILRQMEVLSKTSAASAGVVGTKTVESMLNEKRTKKLGLTHLLGAVRRLNEDSSIPAKHGNAWEQKVIDKLVALVKQDNSGLI